MKHLSRLALVGFIPLSLFSLTSCNKTYYTRARHLAPFLHEITYEDYEEDVNHDTTNMDKTGLSLDFGCSSVRNGNLYGRNYDYYYTNSPSFLVRVKGNSNRFQSIGIANSLNLEESNVIELEKPNRNEHYLNIIPNFTLDGINENGVIANMNVVDYEDGGSPESATTNPGKPQLYLYSTVRYILDHAKSADHAVQLLNEHDIYTLNRHKNNVHLMIADPAKTIIVEFVREKGKENVSVRAVEKKGDEQIMTNFYNNLTTEELRDTYHGVYRPTDPLYNENAHGVERYEYIKSNYRRCNKVDDLLAVLEHIRYGNIYLNPIEPDFPSEDFSQTDIFLGDYEGYRDIYNDTRYVLDNGRRDIGRKMDVWLTMHSSIYNIQEKTLRLNVQEDYIHTYNYDLNF